MSDGRPGTWWDRTHTRECSEADPRAPVPDDARQRGRVRRRLEDLAEARELREAGMVGDWPD